MITKVFKLSYGVFVLIFCCAFVSCKSDYKKEVKQTEIKFTKEGELTIFKGDSTKVNLDIEIADTEYDTQTGLMYRNSMAPNQGMLFIFEDVSERFFYMKNTRIPLDIIYIDDQMKIVSFQKQAQPFNENSLPSNAPAKYVLEINAGLSDQWQLAVNDSISFER
ncbi:DUF192 domain-containing protein [Aestuariibaculum sediminum]|uniref:DUF192 domain-containing protein n=1 Tax=Aestuariibaculum sediminum TaxID=2770637 RepID=A0A8J6QAS8_9FLAO|nr:DUF192 domain-containing protein [Aestuariibaculum sediminum]MBD0832251.1 DUF192 domain-containing protein [Aestuariibaculum sediminum]